MDEGGSRMEGYCGRVRGMRPCHTLSRRGFLGLAACACLSAASTVVLHGCAEGHAEAAQEGRDAGRQEAAKLITFLFDTVIEIEAFCEKDVLDEVEERLGFFERTFSKTIEGSDIHAINHAQGAPCDVRRETAELIARALGYCEQSSGLFDITIGGVADLWDFKTGVIPDEVALAEALRHVDYRLVDLDEQTVTVADPMTRIDLGAIAKGYIADDIVALLRSRGCTSALISLGGNVYALGTRPDRGPWQIGVQDPGARRGTALAYVPAIDSSVVTSGKSERCFERNGIIYHHLLDPRTGMPMRNDVASATIISERSIDGDAYTTIAFLMGMKEGLAFIDGREGMQALFVGEDGSLMKSGQLEVMGV